MKGSMVPKLHFVAVSSLLIACQWRNGRTGRGLARSDCSRFVHQGWIGFLLYRVSALRNTDGSQVMSWGLFSYCCFSSKSWWKTNTTSYAQYDQGFSSLRKINVGFQAPVSADCLWQPEILHLEQATTLSDYGLSPFREKKDIWIKWMVTFFEEKVRTGRRELVGNGQPKE